jgi:hypothetical protein
VTLALTLASIVCGLLLLVVTLWKLPQFQVRHLKGLPPEEIFDRTNEARKTMAQILGGVILLGGFYFNWRGQNETVRDSQDSRTIASDAQITDAFTKAIEQLGNTRLEVQLGGIFGLERLAQEPRMNHWTVMEVLTAYVRTYAPEKDFVPLQARPAPELRPTQIQAILTVLARREVKKEAGHYLDLRYTRLAGMDLSGANLAYADLYGADLQFVDLRNGSLRGATLTGTHLENAQLDGTCLNKPTVENKETDLSQASYTVDSLEKAWWDNGTSFNPKLHPRGNPAIPEPDYCK